MGMNDTIVREYFELNGFLVLQPRKHTVPGRHKTAREEVDFVLTRPVNATHGVASSFVWTGDDLRPVARAIVGILGWHSERLYPARLEKEPDLYRFAEKDALRYAQNLLGTGKFARILCLPRLPVGEDLRSRSVELLKERGIDGVITFGTMLMELARSVDVNRNYGKSDLLQIMRLLKNYDLIRDEQLDLFIDRRNRP